MSLKKQAMLKLLTEVRKDLWDCKSVVLQLSGSVLEGVHVILDLADDSQILRKAKREKNTSRRISEYFCIAIFVLFLQYHMPITHIVIKRL